MTNTDTDTEQQQTSKRNKGERIALAIAVTFFCAAAINLLLKMEAENKCVNKEFIEAYKAKGSATIKDYFDAHSKKSKDCGKTD